MCQGQEKEPKSSRSLEMNMEKGKKENEAAREFGFFSFVEKEDQEERKE